MPNGPLLQTGLDRPQVRQRYEQISDHLVGEIRRGALAPGSRLPGERDFAQRLGVARATVREALGALQLRGLVETRPGAGSFVAADAAARLTAGDGPAADLALPADAGPAAVLDARRILEPEIARLAAGRASGPDPAVEALLEVMEASLDPSDAAQRRAWSDADREFHRRLAHATANPVLMAIADHLAALMDQPLWRRLRDDSIAVPGRTTLQLAEHRLIAAAIAEGDPDLACRQAVQHIDRARRYMALN